MDIIKEDDGLDFIQVFTVQPPKGGTQFAQAGMIRVTKVEGRRRSYLLTDFGRDTLRREYERLCAQAEDYRLAFGEE